MARNHESEACPPRPPIPIPMPISTDTRQRGSPHTLPGKCHRRVWEKLGNPLPIYDCSELRLLFFTHVNICQASWLDRDGDSWAALRPLRQSQWVPQGQPSCAQAASLGNPASLLLLPISLITGLWMHEAAGKESLRVPLMMGRKLISNMQFILLWRVPTQP